MNAYLADAQKFTNAVALVRLEKAVDAHLLKVSLAEVGSGVAGVELGVGPHVADALFRNVLAARVHTVRIKPRL
jgi:hypothetical protein